MKSNDIMVNKISLIKIWQIKKTDYRTKQTKPKWR